MVLLGTETERRAEMTWCWVTERKKPDPKYDWQGREPVTAEMKDLINKAWEAYDGSDSTNVPVTHEESVLARYAVEKILDLQAELIETLTPHRPAFPPLMPGGTYQITDKGLVKVVD